MIIETSHESPTSVLPESHAWNDYDYALVHLFEEEEEYYNYFRSSVLAGRTVYLDNSIFELGESYDEGRYLHWINKLQPTVYIVPDTLENGNDTIDKFRKWSHWNDREINTPDYEPIKMGVVQGENWNELVECYQFMSKEADMIAISFDYSYYGVTGLGTSILEWNCSGRQRFINQLINEGYWNWSKPHHLLGCSLAKEFRHYVDHDIWNIRSCDTSNPVVAAIKGLRYRDDLGLTTKPSTLLADLINHELDTDQMELLNYNTRMFKKILKR